MLFERMFAITQHASDIDDYSLRLMATTLLTRRESGKIPNQSSVISTL